jgi:serine/threonine protein kinase
MSRGSRGDGGGGGDSSDSSTRRASEDLMKVLQRAAVLEKELDSIDVTKTAAGRISQCTATGKNCNVCAKLPFHRSSHLPSFMMDYGAGGTAAWDFDAGLFDLICQMNEFAKEDGPAVDRELARQTAESALRHARRLRRELVQHALLQREEQNFAGDAAHARVVAPFQASEILTGQLLGTGGFSAVYEVASFQPDSLISESTIVGHEEKLSRQYLIDHALRYGQPGDEVDFNDDTKVEEEEDDGGESLPSRPSSVASRTTVLRRDREKQKRKQQQNEHPVSRYAIKHLRQDLVTRGDPDKFKRAAIDLVLEGQLLLVMDHPNIVSIRGWSLAGPDALRSGRHTDYFLILDRLPESLEERLESWRHLLRKYRSRANVLLWGRRKRRDKFAAKQEELFQKRLKAAHDVASALEYMHNKRIIHRDMKTSNIGFDVRGDLKIYDFGLSRLLPPEEERVCVEDDKGRPRSGFIMSRVGTKFYMAPEIRSKSPYDLAADVYSFGVIFWEILALSTPRETFYKSKKSSKTEISKDLGQYWMPVCPCWPSETQQLVSAALSEDPADRPSMVAIRTRLKSQLEACGHLLTQRRRSTFRLDLSKVLADADDSESKTEGGSNMVDESTIATNIDESTVESKISRITGSTGEPSSSVNVLSIEER